MSSDAAAEGDAGSGAGSGTAGEGGSAGEGEAPVGEETIPDPREVTRKPTTLSGGLAMFATVLVMVLGGVYSVAGFGLGALALAIVALSVVVGSRALADAAGLALLLAVVAVGTAAPGAVTLALAVFAVLAWDTATNAIELGEQLGREADTERAELVHAGATLGVGGVTAGIAFAVFNLASGGQPVTALILLLLAALALISALRL